MSNREAAEASKLDPFKWVVALGLVIAGIYGYYHFDQYPVLYRVLGLLPVILVALLLAVWTQGGGAFWALMKEARLEIYKVVWPTRQETTQTTMIVLLVVVIMAIILWLLDWAFSGLSSLILG